MHIMQLQQNNEFDISDMSQNLNINTACVR